MKNDIKLNFERNEYYNGKLLSASDFIIEQDYFNSKRRLLNILNMGSGIMYGLDVVQTGDNREEESISIKPGVAIDTVGREITVTEIENVLLAKLEGLPQEECFDCAKYLCIEYSEDGKGEVSSEERTDGKFYNRKLEKYRVFLESEPWTLLDEVTKIAFNIKPVYEDSDVLIWHKSPMYMNTGKPFECSFMIIKLKRDVRVKMDYNVKTEQLEVITKKVSFENKGKGEKSECEYNYVLMGGDSDGTILVKDLKLIVEDNIIPVDMKVLVQSEKMPLLEKLTEEYFNTNMVERLREYKNGKLCIAKVFLNNYKTMLGSKAHISLVEQSIFTRYIYPQFFRNLFPETIEYVNRENEGVQDSEEIIVETEASSRTGIIKIAVEDVFKKVHFTEEIEHGLGSGSVAITAGLVEQEDSLVSKMGEIDEMVYSGNMDVFFKSGLSPSFSGISIGVMQYPKKGSFRLGVSVQGGDVSRKWMVIRWWANLCNEE